MQFPDGRHDPDGIDFDVYRARAREMRAEAKREFASRAGTRKAAALIGLSMVAIWMAGLSFQGTATGLPSSVASAGVTSKAD